MPDTPTLPAVSAITGLFWAILGAAVVLALLIVILPSNLFLAPSNYLQIIAALAGALVLLYLWHAGRQQVLLWTGAGFGLWGIANIGWYVSTFLGFRDQVFPSVIDIGLILGLLLIAFGLWTGLLGGKPALAIIITILVLSLSVPALMLFTAGFGLTAAIVTYFYFATCGLLIAGGLHVKKGERPLLIGGTILLGLSFMIYPLREIYLAQDPLLLVIGPIVCVGFSLLMLGLLPSCKPAAKA